MRLLNRRLNSIRTVLRNKLKNRSEKNINRYRFACLNYSWIRGYSKKKFFVKLEKRNARRMGNKNNKAQRGKCSCSSGRKLNSPSKRSTEKIYSAVPQRTARHQRASVLIDRRDCTDEKRAVPQPLFGFSSLSKRAASSFQPVENVSVAKSLEKSFPLSASPFERIQGLRNVRLNHR